MSPLLVVAGEASGDRAGAQVLVELGALVAKRPEAFGLGGGALERVGLDLVADLRDFTALGIGEVVARAGPIAAAHARILHAARIRKPRAALLVNYTEFNLRLAPRLHAAGVRVLWYGAPQIWAWRPGRAVALRRAVDHLAVVLPFEEELWRAQGVDAEYVGHPALEITALDRPAARAALGLTPYAPAVAILPGSRPHEVRAHLDVMLDAYERVRRDRASLDARVLLAGSLDARTREAALLSAQTMRVPVFEVDPNLGAGPILPAFDAALCASGTASLEAALARAVPIVVYKAGLLTELAARAFVRTKRFGLPNVLLGRDAFCELVQRDVNSVRVGKALTSTLNGRRDLLRACDEVEACLGDKRTPSREVARMLARWLDG